MRSCQLRSAASGRILSFRFGPRGSGLVPSPRHHGFGHACVGQLVGQERAALVGRIALRARPGVQGWAA